MTITEQQIIDSWSKWGDGSELKPGFAKWLAEFLNKPSFAPSDLYTRDDVEVVRLMVEIDRL